MIFDALSFHLPFSLSALRARAPTTRQPGGFDDRHLDFRVIVDVAAFADGARVTATTIVLTHNFLGRAYLFTIMPFHRLIARSMVGQARA